MGMYMCVYRLYTRAWLYVLHICMYDTSVCTPLLYVWHITICFDVGTPIWDAWLRHIHTIYKRNPSRFTRGVGTCRWKTRLRFIHSHYCRSPSLFTRGVGTRMKDKSQIYSLTLLQESITVCAGSRYAHIGAKRHFQMHYSGRCCCCH